MKSVFSAIASAMLAACAAASANPVADTSAPPLVTQIEPEIKQLRTERPLRILFVGNSYFYYNDSLHNHVRRMVDAAGTAGMDELSYKSATIGGASLRDHPIDHLLVPDNLRVAEPFQVVVMQGGSAEPLSEDRRALFKAAAISYAAKVREAGGEPVLYLTPAYVAPHQRYRANMIEDIRSLYLETGNDIDALVIPVGIAFAEAYRRRPDIQLHKSFDGSHPSLLGTYLAAATIFASLYGVSPVGNTYDYFGEVNESDARFLQEVAYDTVTEFFGRAGE